MVANAVRVESKLKQGYHLVWWDMWDPTEEMREHAKRRLMAEAEHHIDIGLSEIEAGECAHTA